MVQVLPFRGIRYDTRRVPNMSQVLAPPYDVITPEMQEALYRTSPHNIVRIDFNKTEPNDGELTRYARAASTYKDWLTQQILRADPSPCFYVLAQRFRGPDGIERTRTGLFGRVKLHRFDEGEILPHERTLRGPKVDRLRLFRSTGANLSPVFGIYQDPEHEIGRLLASSLNTKAELSAELDHVAQKFWVIRDPQVTHALTEAFSRRKIFIADGHHRYETGLAYRDERRDADKGKRLTETPGYESILMFLAAIEDPGMAIYATHRLVFGLSTFDKAEFFAKFSTFFTVTPLVRDFDSATSQLHQRANRPGVFLAVTTKAAYLLEMKDNPPWSLLQSPPHTPLLRTLDVKILHDVVIEHFLGISAEAQASQKNLRYSKDEREAFSSPQNDPTVQIAFLMNPTPLQQVVDIAEAGEIMPQKSTFFYPKVPSGLVLYTLD